MPDPDVDARVDAAVDAWLAWLPRWSPSLARTRPRVCRRCVGSPVIDAAGLREAPHQVQHALVSRIHSLIDDDVASFTATELPLLHAELDRSEAERRAARPYRPEEGLGPEFEGLGVDPEPVPGEPYLFTLAGLAEDAAEPAPPAATRSYDEAAKQQLRREIALSDERAVGVGRAACLALVGHRPRIAEAIDSVVTPQIESLMSELSAGLEIPARVDDPGQGRGPTLA
ncbi:spermidine/putrescine ABC transporter substrate-binding protein [Herbiconiux sp. L3-i23]|uniref:spermidine/putrescine ABC transporter substrate-binding protein n=1 Tax=Herbiconiux sp. L3-i23 TaxID=2905871 RepID=UPI002055EBB8|nr:spermidine/putrescine ABC transporter substrate-binding protein [Herbiconiux sp. L3-i23]BDI23331.1 hypothetical protein L3i23_21070 [Herbiconiux sp. L3-i23]